MDWTLEDNMVDGLFFCATLTSYRGGHTPFVQAGAETSDTAVRRLLSRTRALLGRVIPGGVSVWNENAESYGVVRPLRFHCATRMLLLSDELMRIN